MISSSTPAPTRYTHGVGIAPRPKPRVYKSNGFQPMATPWAVERRTSEHNVEMWIGYRTWADAMQQAHKVANR